MKKTILILTLIIFLVGCGQTQVKDCGLVEDETNYQGIADGKKCIQNAMVDCEPSKFIVKYEEGEEITEVIGSKRDLCVINVSYPKYSILCRLPKGSAFYQIARYSPYCKEIRKEYECYGEVKDTKEECDELGKHYITQIGEMQLYSEFNAVVTEIKFLEGVGDLSEMDRDPELGEFFFVNPIMKNVGNNKINKTFTVYYFINGRIIGQLSLLQNLFEMKEGIAPGETKDVGGTGKDILSPGTYKFQAVVGTRNGSPDADYSEWLDNTPEVFTRTVYFESKPIRKGECFEELEPVRPYNNYWCIDTAQNHKNGCFKNMTECLISLEEFNIWSNVENGCFESPVLKGDNKCKGIISYHGIRNFRGTKERCEQICYFVY